MTLLMDILDFFEAVQKFKIFIHMYYILHKTLYPYENTPKRFIKDFKIKSS